MGTGSSISSIDHNIFQKPYEPVSSLPVGRSYSYPPPPPTAQPPAVPSHSSHYVPPYPPPNDLYNYTDSKPSYPPYPMQPPPYPPHDYSSPNIFYSPPPSLRTQSMGNLPSQPFVKQEPQQGRGWNPYDEHAREQGSFYDGSKKRKVSPCEMPYPEASSAGGVSHYTSYPSPPSSYNNVPSSNGYKSEGGRRAPPETDDQDWAEFSLKEEKKETLTTTVSTEGDGYRWRKYGRKSVKGSPYPRSYYKCTFSSCNVKKQVEMMLKDNKMVVKSCIYKGEHNHDRPCITFAKASNQTSFKNAVIAGFMRHEKMLQGTGDVPRLSVETSKDVDFMDDGYRWRKYGQKYVKGSGYPRSYYKCTEKECAVKKQVDQHGDRITNTYEGVHSHPPCANHPRKRRRTGDAENANNDNRPLPRDIKEEGAGSRCPTPPGSSSELPRRWPANGGGRGQRASDEESFEEEEEEELETGHPVKIYGVAVDDFDDDELDDDFAAEQIRAYERDLAQQRQQYSHQQ